MTALRYDTGKLPLHHIHPVVWQDEVRGLFGNLENLTPSHREALELNEIMDNWFYGSHLNPDLLPASAVMITGCTNLKSGIDVLVFGSRKYASLNYTKGMAYSRVLNSFRRHLFAIANGEEIDPESGLPHIGHALCNTLFAKTYHLLGYDGGEFDDRPKLKENPND
jgi:hypothetical protein